MAARVPQGRTRGGLTGKCGMRMGRRLSWDGTRVWRRGIEHYTHIDIMCRRVCTLRVTTRRPPDSALARTDFAVFTVR